MMAVKKNDTVVVLTGKDKDKTGKVIDVLPKTGKILVQDINKVTRHVKARKPGEASSIKIEEKSINISNVMPLCSACKRPTRLNSKQMVDGSKVRVCNHCKEIY